MPKEEKGVRLGYKFRIYPNQTQEIELNKNIGACRYVFNHYLKLRKDTYEATQEKVTRPILEEGSSFEDEKPIFKRDENGKVIYEMVENRNYDPKAKAMSSFDCSYDLKDLKTKVKGDDGTYFLKEADSVALGYAVRNLDSAFQNFFRGIKKGQRIGYPRFKSRKNEVQSYTTKASIVGIDPEGNLVKTKDFDNLDPAIKWKYICLPKIGNIRIKLHTMPKGKNVSVTISRNSALHWFASFKVKEVEISQLPENDNEIGLTFGISNWVTTSDGEKIDFPERIKELDVRIARAQRKLTRKVPGSNNYKKQLLKVNRLKNKQTNIKANCVHNLTRELVNNYQFIATRKMQSKDMAQKDSLATKELPRKVKKYLNRKTSEGNFFEINRQLAYKSAWAGRTLVEVPNDYPTAQTCSACGYKQVILARDLKSEWTCESCGAVHDRKYNGAQNVLMAGHDILNEIEESFVSKAKKPKKKAKNKG